VTCGNHDIGTSHLIMAFSNSPMKNVLLIPSLAFLLAACSYGSFDANRHPQAQLDIPYTTKVNGASESLSVFLPNHPNAAPILVFFHGGGWRSGDKADLYEFARGLAEAGVITVIPNYRLAPENPYPAQIQDAVDAVKWTQNHAAEWQANRQCLFVGGHSAGAHLASLLVLDSKNYSSVQQSPYPIAGVIGVSGVYRIAPQEGGATRAFIRSVFGSDEAIWHQASPIELLPPSDNTPLPPFALLWMQEEHPLAAKESEQFTQALQQQGQSVIARTLPGSDHTAGINAISSSLLNTLAPGGCLQTTE
jgi:acetyl esterase/lipase